MKLGYSLLLGEYIPADQIRYGDVAGFQIVCPCCRDPLIKVERPTATDVTEFLSHYASKPGTGECELRVASISSETRSQTNQASRGQTLKMFLSVFRDALMLEANRDERIQKAGQYAGVQLFGDLLANSISVGEWLFEQELDALLDIVTRSIDTDRAVAETGLQVSFRRRLTKDIVQHLRAPHAKKSRLFVGRFAASSIASGHYAVPSEKVHPTDKIVAGLKRILTDDTSRTLDWLRDVSDDKEPALTQYNALTTLMAIDLLRTIMRLPALRMLANHRAGRHPLHDIDRLDGFSPSSAVLADDTVEPLIDLLQNDDDPSPPKLG